MACASVHPCLESHLTPFLPGVINDDLWLPLIQPLISGFGNGKSSMFQPVCFSSSLLAPAACDWLLSKPSGRQMAPFLQTEAHELKTSRLSSDPPALVIWVQLMATAFRLGGLGWPCL